MKNLNKRASSREDHFSKILFVLSRCRTAKDDGFKDLLSWSRMHVDECDEIVLVVQQRRRWKPRCVGSWLFIVTSSVALTCIYREDPHRITGFRKWLGLSLSKRIRHELIEKINDKRRPRTCEALGWISTEYLRARRAPTPISSPRHAMPGPVQRGEARRASVHMYFFLFPLLRTLVSA
jgi:hypothetical protein